MFFYIWYILDSRIILYSNATSVGTVNRQDSKRSLAYQDALCPVLTLSTPTLDDRSPQRCLIDLSSYTPSLSFPYYAASLYAFDRVSSSSLPSLFQTALLLQWYCLFFTRIRRYCTAVELILIAFLLLLAVVWLPTSHLEKALGTLFSFRAFPLGTRRKDS